MSAVFTVDAFLWYKNFLRLSESAASLPQEYLRACKRAKHVFYKNILRGDLPENERVSILVQRI